MKYQIQLTAEEYSTMMVGLCFAEVTIKHGSFVDNVKKLMDAITSTVTVVETVGA